jgi:segregation and condensation protein A
MAEQAARPEAQPGFTVQWDGLYEGDLAGLARALRAGSITLAQVDLQRLVRDVLAWFHEWYERDAVLASGALPQAAQVVELKLRLMLPRAPQADEEDDGSLFSPSEALEAIALLEDLEDAIRFLTDRRYERRLVVPASAPRPSFPRSRSENRVTPQTLARIASSLRPTSYFEMAKERLTLDKAMNWIKQAVMRLGQRLSLREAAPTDNWADRTVTFAGMLELVRRGDVLAEQEEPYGAIHLKANRQASR